MKIRTIIFGIIVLFIGMVVGVAMMGGSNTQQKATPNTTVQNLQVEQPQGENIFNYVNWTFYTAQSVGYQTAPTGSMYYVVDVNIKNTGTQTYSTNPYYWELVADGITYSIDAATFDPSINSRTVNIAPGGSFENKYVFLVSGNHDQIFLKYIGPTTAM